MVWQFLQFLLFLCVCFLFKKNFILDYEWINNISNLVSRCICSKVIQLYIYLDSGGSDNKEVCLQCRRNGFDPRSQERFPGRVAAHSSSAWKIPWMGSLAGYSPEGHFERSQTWLGWLLLSLFFLKLFSYLYRILNSVPVNCSAFLLNVVVCLCQPYNFLSLSDLVWFLYSGDGGLVDRVWQCSFLCIFLEEFSEDRCQLFSKYLREFLCEAIWSGLSDCQEF